MWDLAGKRVLITGGASGIGRALVDRLVRQSASLCIVDIDEPALQRTAEECRQQGGNVQTVLADLATEGSATPISRQAVEQLGGIDVLINNAGVGYYGPTDRMTVEQADRLLTINFTAPIHLTNACLPSLLKNRRSHVVNIASMYGLFPTQRSTLYHATKYGLVGHSLALRAEYARFRLGVTAVCPGFVRTQLFSKMMTADGKPARQPPRWISTTADQIARKTVKAIERNRRLVTVTPAARIGYFAQRFCPGLFDLAYQLERKREHHYALVDDESVVEQIDQIRIDRSAA